MNTKPRVVIDTNLLVSALIFGGPISQLRKIWQSGECTPLASKATITELIRVLAYPKFQLSQMEQEELLADYLPFCETVQIPNSPPIIPSCRDPFDLPFLVLAIVGKADYLISGDKDLLTLEGEISFCSIVTINQ
ncbi:putative toxin-antitoxin system toxin component, PIN family, partial [Synechocystis salina LEGE 06155]|nr:putative toxin-antitoxin system toxin component, PIN family [Synechocystis salina LEGE 06155]